MEEKFLLNMQARARAKMKEGYHEKILTFEYIATFFCCEM